MTLSSAKSARAALLAAACAASLPLAAQPLPADPPADVSQPVRPHDFVDTRLTWTFGDDNVLGPDVARAAVSPLPSIGDRPQYRLFFDALNMRYAGRENLTHLALYARAPGFLPRLTTEAMLLVRLDLTALAIGGVPFHQTLYDAGSYLRVHYQTNPARPTDGLSFTFFPFDTERMRLGYLWELSWGGNDVFPRRVGPAPGVRVGFDHGPFSAYLGFKTAGVAVPTTTTSGSALLDETQYGGLGGVGLRFGDVGRFDLAGGFFQQGRLDAGGAPGRHAYLVGGSGRLVFNRNLAPATSIDMTLYRNDPNFPFQVFAQEAYVPGAVAWLASAEVTAMAQRLADADAPGATQLQPGLAGAAQGRVKLGYLGVGLTALYRDVAFLRQNVPSVVPFQAFARDASTTPEYFVAAQVDYRVARANLLPSLVAGVQMPASFSTDVVEDGGATSRRTLLVLRNGDMALLEAGARISPVFSSRLAVRWDLSSIFAALAWVQYVRDPNATAVLVDVGGASQVHPYSNPNQLGFGLTAQARF